jgi:predicted PurR-regulated permease PerM
MPGPDPEPSRRTPFALDARERRWLDALLVLGTVAVGLLALGLISNVLLFWSDILLIFFLAWLLAFVLSPVVTGIERAFPFLRRGIAVAVAYGVLLVILVLIALLVAQALAASLQGFIASIPTLQSRLPDVLAPWQSRVDGLGLQVNLLQVAQQGLTYLGSLSSNLVEPLTDLAVASLGIFGNLLIILFLSLYIVIDRERIGSFIGRLVPPRYADEFDLLQLSLSRSFGGFLRGQALMGLIYGAIALGASVVFGLDYAPLSATASGLLQAIPFFGPFISWAPPVVVAVFTNPGAALPVLIIMAAGWFVVMNIIQPRLMAETVGIHPVVVLGSVIVGAKLAGIAGAVFSVPVAAVLSSFFFYYLSRSSGSSRTVTSRAARLVGTREGRPVRVPQPPDVTAIDPAEPAALDEPAPHAPAHEPSH